ncbi:fimbrial protein [Parabacteroides gordonii]|jgi:hypothetical protein|uniref:fimbrial protein n=1 Tax=Parabacteroides gordonii TaxID=574930 RepID=UPI00241DDA4A|nr:fimbrial protein [Parabacteroides gordonii]
MKLQNLLYATMVACAFSACSNDDDPNIPDPALELDATFTTAFSAVGNSGSSLKSTTKASDDDAFGNVAKIGLAVFNNGAMGTAMATDALLSYMEKTNESDTTACVAAKSGKVKVLVIANPTANMFQDAATLQDFLNKISKEAINTGSLLMSSKVYDLTLKAGRNVMVNDLGNSVFKTNTTNDQLLREENIKVYRNVARVEVPSITVNPREGFGKGKGATLTLSKIFVANVRSGVRVGGQDGGTGLFAADQAWCSVVDGVSALKAGAVTESDAAYSIEITDEIKYTSAEAQTGKKELIDGAQFFVYDNASATVFGTPITEATLLVLKGSYSYVTDAGSTVTVNNAYWTVAINNSLENTSGKDFPAHCGVLRNVKYVMNVTITGPGNGTIDPDSNAASLTSKIEVVNWGEVVLTPDID